MIDREDLTRASLDAYRPLALVPDSAEEQGAPDGPDDTGHDQEPGQAVGPHELGGAAPDDAEGSPDGPAAGEPVEDAPASWELPELGAPGDVPDDVEGEDVAGNDFRILSAPTISLERFTSVLRAAKSPAAKEASAMYAQAIKYGVDPAFLLAIMRKESNFGRAGIAVGRQNGWGLRWYASYADLGGTNRGGWAHFPTWAQGAAAASRLLAGGLYGRSGKYNTARRFPFRWAPAGDGNAPRKYGAQIVSFIRGWGGVPGVTTGNLGGAGKPGGGANLGGGGGGGHKAAGNKARKHKGTAAVVPDITGTLQTGLSPLIIIGAVAVGVLLLLVIASGKRTEG